MVTLDKGVSPRNWMDGEQASDKAFLIALTLSVTAHSVFAVGHIDWHWLNQDSSRKPSAIEMVYDYEMSELDSRLRQSIRRINQAAQNLTGNVSARAIKVHIPERPSVIGDQLADALAVSDSRAIDLSNLQELVAGDPVLLSYFSVVQQRIQRIASRRHWSKQVKDAGIVYVSFFLMADGSVQEINVVGESGPAVEPFKQIAVAIVEHSAPFPSFPESMTYSHQLVTFPLEFL